MTGRRVTLVALAFLLGGVRAAAAHEPLWGETPSIFGPYVYHPEVRFGYMRHGGGPDGDPARELDSEFGLQYGINRFVNVRFTIPVMRSWIDESGADEETEVSGFGDLLLAAKYRFHLVQEKRYQSAQALLFGWKLPTGDDDETDASGARLPPAMQPGSGKHALMIGYAIDQERLNDSAWFSTFYTRELGEGFRHGDMFEIDAAYGRWVVRPNQADHLGINLAIGVHGEWMGDDTLDDDVSADNAHRYAGLHFTPILTKGRAQYRVGVFVPLWKRGDEEMTDFNYEVKAGWEMFF